MVPEFRIIPLVSIHPAYSQSHDEAHGNKMKTSRRHSRHSFFTVESSNPEFALAEIFDLFSHFSYFVVLCNTFRVLRSQFSVFHSFEKRHQILQPFFLHSFQLSVPFSFLSPLNSVSSGRQLRLLEKTTGTTCHHQTSFGNCTHPSYCRITKHVNSAGGRYPQGPRIPSKKQVRICAPDPK